MKSKSLNYTIMVVIIGLFAIASAVISAIAFEFVDFEIFYFVCIALSIVAMISSTRIRGHVVAGILLYNLGFLVNCLFWSMYGYGDDITGQVLNSILTGLVFLAGLAFTHGVLNAKYGKGLSMFCSMVLSVFTLVVVIYNLATKLNGGDALYTACIIIQNLSLFSTMLLPAMHIKYINGINK